MSMSVVNGYLCMSGCDAAQARRGENPREADPMQADKAEQAPGAPDSAVRFGGALAALNGEVARAAEAADVAARRSLARGVDILV